MAYRIEGVWRLGLVLLGLVAWSCESPPPEHPKLAGVELRLGNPTCELPLTEARFAITGKPLTQAIRGSLPVSGVAPVLLPAGEFRVALQTYDALGRGLCRGTLNFAAKKGEALAVTVPLDCSAGCGGSGNVPCEGKPKPEVTALSLPPQQRLDVGDKFGLQALATHPQADPLSYTWSAAGVAFGPPGDAGKVAAGKVTPRHSSTGGVFEVPGQERATAKCLWAGQHEVSVEVTDASGCSARKQAVVTCMPKRCDATAGTRCGAVAGTRDNLIAPAGAKRGLQCPFTDAVVRVGRNQECPRRLPSKLGVWVGQQLGLGAKSKQCRYSWRGSADAKVDRAVLDQRFGAGNWQAECPIASRTSIAGGVPEFFEATGREHLGWPQSQLSGQHTVRIAVVDSAAQPFDSAQSDNFAHGRAVGLVAKDTACAQTGWAQCPVAVSNHLALPYWTVAQELPAGSEGPAPTTVQVDTVNGGSYGSRADLAQAIRDAVEDWQTEVPEQRLVVNLSLAWSSVWGGQIPEQVLAQLSNGKTVLDPALDAQLLEAFDEASEGVCEAVLYASCHGALVLAASGNDNLEPVSEAHPAGPMLPAAWTQLPAPNSAVCAARGVTQPEAPPPGAALLYAVGAADFAAQPLLTRSLAQSAFAGLAFQAVRSDPTRGGFTPLLSGSSMSTAAVSGIAAMTWANDPQLTPHALMQALYAQGASVTRDGATAVSEFCPAGNCKDFPQARRLTLCSVPGQPSCTPPAPLSVLPLEPQGDTFPEAPEETSSAEDENAAPSADQVPWVFPQPDGEPRCTVCTFSNLQDRLSADMSPGFKSLAYNVKLWVNGVQRSLSPPADDFTHRWSGAPSPATFSYLDYRINTGVEQPRLIQVVSITP